VFINTKCNKKQIEQRRETMRNNEDSRRNSQDTIEYKVEKTLENFHETEEMIKKTNDEEMKSALEAKNDRRVATLKNIKKEIKVEAVAKQNNYK